LEIIGEVSAVKICNALLTHPLVYPIPNIFFTIPASPEPPPCIIKPSAISVPRVSKNVS